MPTENNIQMKIKNEGDWELLYPYTKAELVKSLNNFSAINVNNYSIEAGSYKDVLNIIAGDNISITPNNVSKTITISSTVKSNNVIVTENEKTYWNSKEDSTAAALKLEQAKDFAEQYTDSQISLIKIPTKLSLLDNDMNYTTETLVSDKISQAISNIEISGIDLSRYATVEQLRNHIHPENHWHANSQALSLISEEDISSWNICKTYGDYNNLSNKPTIPVNISELNNDSLLSTETFVTDKISDLALEVENKINTEISNSNSETDGKISVLNLSITNKIGTLTQLETLSKNNLVAAVNELLAEIKKLSDKLEIVEKDYVLDTIKTSDGYYMATKDGDLLLRKPDNK